MQEPHLNVQYLSLLQQTCIMYRKGPRAQAYVVVDATTTMQTWVAWACTAVQPLAQAITSCWFMRHTPSETLKTMPARTCVSLLALSWYADSRNSRPIPHPIFFPRPFASRSMPLPCDPNISPRHFYSVRTHVACSKSCFYCVVLMWHDGMPYCSAAP